MLRTPTHIVEIGTNETTTTTTATTPLIQKLQAAGTKYQYHDQYTKTTTNCNKSNKPTVKQQLQQSFIYQHQQQQEKEQKFQLETIVTTATAVEYQLQTKKQKQKQKQKQLQATKSTSTADASSCNKKLKKSKKHSTSSSSSSSSSIISSLSSSGCSALSTTSSSDSSTVSAKTTKINSSSSSEASQTSFTFKEHILSRGLLSTTPFSFMRTKKSKATATAAATVTAKTAETAEIRKTSERLFDLEDKTRLSNNNKKNHNYKTGAAIPETKSTTTTTVTTRTGYFSNILNSSSSTCNNNNNNNTKNIKNNNNNNNNYIKSFPTTNSRSIISTPLLTALSTPTSSSSSTPSPSSVSPIIITNTACVVAPTSLLVAVAVASPPIATTTSMSPTSQTPPSSRSSLFDSCHRKIRLIGGGPVAFLGGLVAKARRKERDGDQNSSDTKLYLEESVLERKLPEADLKALVDLPAGLDYNEWLASHTLALFEHVNLVYGTISEFCTTSGCPDMTGPGNRTYLWFDEKGKKTRVAAPQYIDYVMTFTQKTVSDESIFPTKYANEFPSSFESIARKILRLQFHVIAHLYAAHFREIALLGLHTHLNLTFAHLTALHRRFNLIDEKETDVLRDLEVALRLTDDTTGGITGSGSSQNDATETNSTSSGGGSGSGGGVGVDSNKGSLVEDVNLVQHNNLMDCNTTAQPPICTQPEANLKSQQFGGGGGLIGGILGDLSSGEFGDTMHYCTSAVPASSNTNNTCSNHTSTPNTCSTNSTCTTADEQQQQQSTVGAVTTNGNNGAGALNFHLNNNNHLAHHPHTHQPHHHHHNHNNVHHNHHHHNHPYAQNTGLIQCNASNAPTATNATTSTTTA